jgi:hypothetical protein
MSIASIQISFAYAILNKSLAPLVDSSWILQPIPIALTFFAGLIVARTLDVKPTTKIGKWIVCAAGLQMLSTFWTQPMVYGLVARKFHGSNVAQIHVALAGVYTLAFGLGTLQPKRGFVVSLLGIVVAILLSFFQVGDTIMNKTMVEPCKAWFGLAVSVLLYSIWLLVRESRITGPKLKRTSGEDFGVDTSRRPVLALAVLIPLLGVAWFGLNKVPQCCSGATCYPEKIPNVNYTIIDKVYSNSGYLEVVEEPGEPIGRGVRILRSNHAFLGGYFLDSKESIFANFYFQALARFADIRQDNDPLSVLILGMGAGAVAGKFIEARDKVHIVEYDAKVVQFAQKYFPWVERGYPVSTMRAEDFVKDAPSGFYDVVVCDLYPHDIDLDEMLPEFKRILRHGVTGADKRPYLFIYNWVGRIHGHNANVITQKLTSQFPSISAFSESAESPDNSTNIDNLVFYASRDEVTLELGDEMRGGYMGPLQQYINENLEDLTMEMAWHRIPGKNNTLSDWELEDAKQQHYSSMLDMFGPDFWARY